jgi:hypothetical protein
MTFLKTEDLKFIVDKKIRAILGFKWFSSSNGIKLGRAVTHSVEFNSIAKTLKT